MISLGLSYSAYIIITRFETFVTALPLLSTRVASQDPSRPKIREAWGSALADRPNAAWDAEFDELEQLGTRALRRSFELGIGTASACRR